MQFLITSSFSLYCHHHLLSLHSLLYIHYYWWTDHLLHSNINIFPSQVLLHVYYNYASFFSQQNHQPILFSLPILPENSVMRGLALSGEKRSESCEWKRTFPKPSRAISSGLYAQVIWPRPTNKYRENISILQQSEKNTTILVPYYSSRNSVCQQQCEEGLTRFSFLSCRPPYVLLTILPFFILCGRRSETVELRTQLEGAGSHPPSRKKRNQKCTCLTSPLHLRTTSYSTCSNCYSYSDVSVIERTTDLLSCDPSK